MDTQRPLFERLVFGPFPLNLAYTLFPRRKPEDTFYCRAGYKVREPNYNNPDAPEKAHEHDVVLTLTHFGTAPDGNKKIFGKITASIEIKTTVGDVFDSDVDKYFGATPVFFVLGPPHILTAVICKYHDHERKHLIGMIDSDTGQIVVLPHLQSYHQDRQDRLLSQESTSIHNIPEYNDTGPFSLRRLTVYPVKPLVLMDFDGIRVSEDYLDLFRQAKENGYSSSLCRHGI